MYSVGIPRSDVFQGTDVSLFFVQVFTRKGGCQAAVAARVGRVVGRVVGGVEVADAVIDDEHSALDQILSACIYRVVHNYVNMNQNVSEIIFINS